MFIELFDQNQARKEGAQGHMSPPEEKEFYPRQKSFFKVFA